MVSYSIADVTVMIIHWYALGASLCCAALFLWWVLFQNAHRCDSCGSAPVMCRCTAASES